MSVSAPVSRTAQLRRPHLLALTVAAAAVMAIAVWAIASSVTGSAPKPRQPGAIRPSGLATLHLPRTSIEALGGMSGAQLRAQQAAPATASEPATFRLRPTFVEGIGAMSLAQLAAAFGTGHALMSNSPLSAMTPAELQRSNAVLAHLTPGEQRYVRAIESTSYRQLAAAFGASK